MTNRAPVVIARVVQHRSQPAGQVLFRSTQEAPGRIYFEEPPPPQGSIVEATLGHKETVDASRWRILAAAGSGHAELFWVLEKYRVDPFYPPEVLREVENWLAHPGLDDPQLQDMTELPFVTIDNDDSRDLDQALFITRAKTGTDFTVYYALADAAYYVPSDSALFREALNRGVSYYLPGYCVPMLPPELSEGLVSLNPGESRRALVFVITVDSTGRASQTRLQRAKIKSRAKLSYSGVQLHFDRPEQSPLTGQSYLKSLAHLRSVGELRIRRAAQRQVVTYQRSESDVVLQQDGYFQFALERRNDVSLWNEQISLLCNIEGARFMSQGEQQRQVQPVYRVHRAPSQESLQRLEEVIAAIVEQHRLAPEVWLWRAAQESLADYLGRLPDDLVRTPDLGTTMGTTGTNAGIRLAIERQIMMTNRRSTFTGEPGRHHALGVDPYSRFSSPMREIVGIYTHKEALEKLGLLAPLNSPEQDEDLRQRVIDAANRAKQRQKQMTGDIFGRAASRILSRDLALPLSERPLYTGVVLGIRSTRLYIRLHQPETELKVYTDHLETFFDCRYRFDGKVQLRCVEGRGPDFCIGQSICLRCFSHDTTAEKWHLVPVSDAL